MPLRTARHDMALIAALLTTAETEARALGDSEPGAEHLLLASLLVDDASARDALGVSADALREAIRTVHAQALTSVSIVADGLEAPLPPSRGVYRSEASAREVFQRSRTLARRSPTGLRAAHVLIAAAERDHGTAARVLRHLDVDRDAIVADARAMVSRPQA